jgi:hypothetical protein
MKPRRTLLVVINKKVEWGICVADIAVKCVNFRLHRSGGPRGTELAACDALAKALDYLPLALDQAAVYIGRPGRRGVGFAALSAPVGANPILLDQLSPSALRLPRADGILTGQRIFVDFAVPHDNAKISVGFFEGPDVFQGIAIGESAKQRDQGRFTKHNAPHPCTCQNAGCAQHWRSAVALDDNPARNRPIAIVTFKLKPANVSTPTGGTPRLSTSMRVSRSFAAPSPSAVANVMIPSRISTGPRAVDRLS